MQRENRYYVRSPDGRAIFGFDRIEAATVAALEFGSGACLVDTLAQAYFPLVQEVKSGAAGKELVYLPYGGWDTGRFGVDRDLIEGIKKGHVAIVHAFLAKGASPNAKDSRGGPALHWAVGRGKAEIVRLLVGAGADLEARDGAGRRALDVARARHNDAAVEVLLAAGAAP